jgi:hypothetical protein
VAPQMEPPLHPLEAVVAQANAALLPTLESSAAAEVARSAWVPPAGIDPELLRARYDVRSATTLTAVMAYLPSGFLVVFEKPNRSSFPFPFTTYRGVPNRLQARPSADRREG